MKGPWNNKNLTCVCGTCNVCKARQRYRNKYSVKEVPEKVQKTHENPEKSRFIEVINTTGLFLDAKVERVGKTIRVTISNPNKKGIEVMSRLTASPVAAAEYVMSKAFPV